MKICKKINLSLISAFLMLSMGACSQSPAVPVQTTNTTNTEETVSPVAEPEPEPEPSPEEILPVTVEILGKEYEESTTFIDLSDMHPEDITEVSEKMTQLPELSEVNLMVEGNEPLLSLPAVVVLKEEHPNVHFIYEFDMYEQGSCKIPLKMSSSALVLSVAKAKCLSPCKSCLLNIPNILIVGFILEYKINSTEDGWSNLSIFSVINIT